MQDILNRYILLLKEVDEWFAGCMAQYPGQVACHKGCSECCRGLFDITLLDAFLLKDGFNLLPAEHQTRIITLSESIIQPIHKEWPLFDSPWLLNQVDESEWDVIMPDEDERPCVMLFEGKCLLYDYRPMTCRLNGIPMIDLSGEELFDEWCTLNFTDCDPRQLQGLRFRFNDLFTQELLLFREFTKRLTGKPVNELDTIIPAVVVMDAKHFAVKSASYLSDPGK